MKEIKPKLAHNFWVESSWKKETEQKWMIMKSSFFFFEEGQQLDRKVVKTRFFFFLMFFFIFVATQNIEDKKTVRNSFFPSLFIILTSS